MSFFLLSVLGSFCFGSFCVDSCHFGSFRFGAVSFDFLSSLDGSLVAISLDQCCTVTSLHVLRKGSCWVTCR